MDLVIGIHCNYGSKLKTETGGLYYFLKSLRNVNNTCNVIILCRNVDMVPVLVQFCKEMNAQLVPSIPDSVNDVCGIQRVRYLQIYELLSKDTAEIYNKILMSDLADVIFQEDPFQFEIDGVYPAAEQNILSDSTNTSSRLNMHWINDFSFLGLDYSRFINKPVICCGTILGTHKNIMDYLQFYYKINQDLRNDQAVMNIYTHHYIKVDVKPYESSKILTLDKVDFNSLIKNEKGQIMNENNELYAIIHQINRCNMPYMLSLVE